jgi:hypothetical protein
MRDMADGEKEFIEWLLAETQANRIHWQPVPDLLGGTQWARMRGPLEKRLYTADVKIDDQPHAVMLRADIPALAVLPTTFRLTVTDVSTGADKATARSTDPRSGVSEAFEQLWKAVEAQVSSPFETLLEGIRKAG